MKTFKEGDYVRGDEITEEQVLYVSAFPLTGQKVSVRTTHKHIMDGLKSIGDESKEELRNVYRSVYQSISGFNADNIVRRIQQGDRKAKEEWQDFCDDVVLGYCVRLVLHDKAIPATMNPPNFDDGCVDIGTIM